jgi:hypothetical protein
VVHTHSTSQSQINPPHVFSCTNEQSNTYSYCVIAQHAPSHIYTEREETALRYVAFPAAAL